MITVLERLRRLRLVPLIVIDDPAKADPLARALVEGGLPCAEIAFRTPGAARGPAPHRREHPDLLVGAGTVLTPDQAEAARGAGARFIVSPGLDDARGGLLSRARSPGLPGRRARRRRSGPRSTSGCGR